MWWGTGISLSTLKLIIVCYWIAVGYLEILDFFPNAKPKFVS